MAERQTVTFTINEDSLKRMAEYLEREYSESGDWSSPEQLFRNFMKKLDEELGDTQGVGSMSEQIVEGEMRLSVKCGQPVAEKAAEILEGDTTSDEENPEDE